MVRAAVENYTEVIVSYFIKDVSAIPMDSDDVKKCSDLLL